MFKGAIILGVGYALGYAKASYDNEETRAQLEKLNTNLQEFVTKAWNQGPPGDNTNDETVETPLDPKPEPGIE